MSAQPYSTPRVSAAEFAASVAVVARTLDSHGFRPWSLHISQHEQTVTAYVERDELTRLAPDVDDAKVTPNGEFMHLNGCIDGVPVEFYADATEADKVEASNARQSAWFEKHPRSAARP